MYPYSLWPNPEERFRPTSRFLIFGPPSAWGAFARVEIFVFPILTVQKTRKSRIIRKNLIISTRIAGKYPARTSRDLAARMFLLIDVSVLARSSTM